MSEDKKEKEEENLNISPALKRLIEMRKRYEEEQKERKIKEQQLSVVMDKEEIKPDVSVKLMIEEVSEEESVIQPKKTKKSTKSKKSAKIGYEEPIKIEEEKEKSISVAIPENYKTLEEENIELKKEIEQLKKSLSENILKRQSIERLIEDVNSQIIQLKNENASLKSILEEFQKQKREDKEEVKSLAQKMEEQRIFEQEIQKLKDQNEELKKRLSYFEDKLKKLEKEKTTTPSTYSEQFATTISNLIKNLNMRIEEQQKIIEELKKQQINQIND